jgi:hypothetical protein
MKAALIDVIGLLLIAIGILMTAMLFFAERRPPVDIESTTIQEVPTEVLPSAPVRPSI